MWLDQPCAPPLRWVAAPDPSAINSHRRRRHPGIVCAGQDAMSTRRCGSHLCKSPRTPKGALSPYDQEARERVSAACTPYKFGVLGEREAHDGLFYLEAGSAPGAALVEVTPECPDDELRRSIHDTWS